MVYSFNPKKASIGKKKRKDLKSKYLVVLKSKLMDKLFKASHFFKNSKH